MDKITVITIAYNAERTIKRAVDSVINQTFRDFDYTIVDHGSTDGTRLMIQEYERKDTRIHGVYLDANGVNNGDFDATIKLILEHMKVSRADYAVVLDSDDFYEKTALEHMLIFAEHNNCDVVCCGSNFVLERTGEVRGRRMMQSNVFLKSKNEFNDLFPNYHQFMRAHWGKLISLDIIRHTDFSFVQKNVMGDTGLMLATFECANCVGFLAEPLHTWHMSEASGSHTYLTQRRVDFNIYCYTRAIDFLKAKCDSVSPLNQEFMLCVFMNELKDSFAVMQNSDMAQTEKLSLLRAMFINDHARALAGYSHFGSLMGNTQTFTAQRKELFQAVLNLLIKLKGLPNDKVEGYCELGEFVSAAAGDAKCRIAFKKQLVQYLLDRERGDEASAKIDELAELLPDDTEVQEMKKKHKEKALADKGLESQQVIPPPVTNAPYRNGCDDEYYALIERLKTESLNQLLTTAANSANEWLKEDCAYYGLLLKWYRDWYRVGAFAQDQGFVNYFGGMYQYLKQNASELVALYESLADYRSKLTLKIMLQHWLTFHPHLGKLGYLEGVFTRYFDFDIVKCEENEVFVDCGAFDGDTILGFIKAFGGRYKSIYGYELTSVIYNQGKERVKDISRVYYRNLGVANENGSLPVADYIEGTARLDTNGNSMARVVRIDDDIQEDVTFIKMDIEGAECEAIRGAECQIRRNKPKLAISLYHKLSDLLDVPRIVKSYAPEYKFYLRHYPASGIPFPTEYLLYAVTDEVQPSAVYAAPVSTTTTPATKQQIVIAGVNQYAQKLKQMLTQENGGYTLTHFFDETDANTGKSLDGVEIIGIKQLKKLYDSENIGRVIVAYSGFSYPYNKTYEILHEAGINDKVYVVPVDWYSKQDCRWEDALVQADMTRGAIDFMEIDVCPHCNFACRGCAALAPKMEPEFMTVAEFEETLKLLIGKFWHISRFRISGGETLLHPNCADFVRLTRQYYPTAELAVQSNGLLIYIHPERLIALFEAMRDCHCRMYISAYKPTVAKKKAILNTLQKYGVEFFWAGPANGAPIEKFAKKKLIRPESDVNEEYRLCGADGVCHTIRDGYLYPCGNVVNGFIRIQEAFDMKFEGFDDSLWKIRIDIRDTALDGYELARHLNTATPACRYCSAKRQVSYEWKQVPGKRQSLEDFVIM